MSGITISIKAGDTYKESTVTATGTLVHIISDSERVSFGIGSDADLKRAIGKYFGKEPDNAYLKSPTPWGDLYKRYGWPQVQRVLKPIKAQILDVKATPTILSINTLTNESKKTATYATKISEQVTNTVSTQWSHAFKVSVAVLINCEIGFIGYSVGGEAKYDLEYAFGKSETMSKQTTGGMEAGVTVELKPRESAIVELCASSGTMRVRITYEAHLIGRTTVNYSDRYKGHHFWALDIGAVVGKSNKVEIVQDIEVGYYSNASVKVKNAITTEEMMFHMADHPSEHPFDVYPDEPPSADHPDESPFPDHPDEPLSGDCPD